MITGTDIELDSVTGDLLLTNGDLTLVSDIDAIGQHLKQRLSFFLGEWFLDNGAGVPYFQLILVKNPNFALVETVLRNVVLETPGITVLNTFNFSFNARTRGLGIEVVAETINGTLNFSEIIEA